MQKFLAAIAAISLYSTGAFATDFSALKYMTKAPKVGFKYVDGQMTAQEVRGVSDFMGNLARNKVWAGPTITRTVEADGSITEETGGRGEEFATSAGTRKWKAEGTLVHPLRDVKATTRYTSKIDIMDNQLMADGTVQTVFLANSDELYFQTVKTNPNTGSVESITRYWSYAWRATALEREEIVVKDGKLKSATYDYLDFVRRPLAGTPESR